VKHTLLHTTRTALIAVTGGIAITITSAACAPFGIQSSTLPATVTECVLPDDQEGTLIGSWGKLPIPLAIESGTGGFDTNEIAAILAAAATWNAHFEAVIGQPAFDTGEGDSVRITTRTSAEVCSTTVLTASGSFSGAVPILKQTDWNHTSSAQIALTLHCSTQTLSGGGTFGSVRSSVMDINYENFFVDGTVKHDLQSIVAHELGHVLGANHSCEEGGADGTPDCEDPEVTLEYTTALLYPGFGFFEDLTGEVRRFLNANDQGRTNCLYESLRPPSE
jgi:hypothetical protein